MRMLGISNTFKNVVPEKTHKKVGKVGNQAATCHTTSPSPA
jgi:hypothetical protein